MSDYRFDEDFDYFLEKFGEPHDAEPIPEAVIEAYRGKLPEQLFVYWRALGACGFGKGRFWMVNPAEYQDLLDSWLEGSPFEGRNDLSVIARNAFGVLRVWAGGKDEVLSINPHVNCFFYYRQEDDQTPALDKEDFNMRCFWGFKSPERVDEADAQDKPLFDRALKKLGPLKPDEMYGYAHRLALGGKEALSNLEIVKIEVYHDIAQQMESPQIIAT